MFTRHRPGLKAPIASLCGWRPAPGRDRCRAEPHFPPLGLARQDQLWGGVTVLSGETFGLATRISMLKASIHAGNSNSTQSEKLMVNSSASATTTPVTVSHRDTIS